MAIEITRLTTQQGQDLTFIKAWFDANASEFFDSSEISTDTLLLKNSGGDTIMSIQYSSAFTFRVYVNNNLTITRSPSSSFFINRLVKTEHGIAIGLANTSTDAPYCIFISKTSAGRVGVIIQSSMNTSLGSFCFESIGGSTRSYSTDMSSGHVLADAVTTLTPCVCEGANGEYFPDCFITAFSQYKNLIDCTFLADGSEYLYNGFIAMR